MSYTRILGERIETLEKEAEGRRGLCEEHVFSCLADTARLLQLEQRNMGLICPEIENRILNGIEGRSPYDFIIEGPLIRIYFSSGQSLNPKDIDTDAALNARCVLYDIEFWYNSGCDTYHFTETRSSGPPYPAL